MTDLTNDIIIISSGQTVSDLNVGKDGWVEVEDGGTLQTATVNDGGWVTISSGGIATGIVENGGYIDDRNGAVVTFTANTIPSLVVSAGQNASIHSATTVTTTLVTDGGWLNICPGANVNDLTVISGGQIDTDGNVTSVTAREDGYINVRGGLMNGATIDQGGVGVVYYRGTAWNVAVNSGGRYMMYGGLAAATTVASGGYFLVQEGYESSFESTYIGSATQTVVTGGTMRVLSGGAATEVNMSDGYLSAFNRGWVDQLIMTGGTVLITGTTEGIGTLTNLDMLGGFTEVESDGIISGATVAGGNVMVRSAGTLAEAKLCSGAGATILGSASAIELSGATATVFGAVTTAVLNTGDFLLQSGAVVDGATVNAGFVWNTQADTLVTGTTVNGGQVTVAGSASGAIVDQGSFTVVMGGTANDVTIYDGSVAVNGIGAVAGGVNVGSAPSSGELELFLPPEDPKSATLDVLNGGYVENLTVNRGGTANVGVLATVAGATTTASNAVINLSAGATMREVEVNFGTVNVAGILTDVALHGYASIPVGAMFPPATPVGAELNVLSGGTAFNATLDSAYAVIGDGGVVSGATLNKVAQMTVSSGGVLTGQISIEDEKNTGVTVSEGGVVNFDLTGATAGDAARIVGLKRISGAPTYTLTVDADLAVGTYRLADNAGTFNGSITVKTAADELGSISFVDYLQVGENYYILKSRSGGVDLCISAEAPSLPYVTVYANSEWAGLADGTSVDVEGGTAIIGADAFASADQASDALLLDGVLHVTGGTAVFVYGVNRTVVVESGALVTDTKVNSGATLTLNTGASACNLVIEENAALVAQSGTTLTGECPWDTDAVIAVDGEIVFDVSASTAETYITQYCNLYKNTGTPSYTVVIGETQENGLYALALNSQGRGVPATLKLADGTEIGTLTADTALRYGEQTYTLSNGSGASANWLQLVVADYIPIFEYVYVNSEWSGLEKGAVVEVEGGTALFGIDAFADADSAIVSTLEGGTIIIEGGVAQFTDAIARNVTVKSGATLCDPFLPNGLTLTVNAGGTIAANGAAETSFSSGSTVQLNGGTLNFDITAPGAASATLLSGLSYVQGTPDLVLTVEDDQSSGVYTLSTEAAGFAGSITVKNTSGESVGTLTVGGTPVSYGSLTYTLSLSDEGVLSVTADVPLAPVSSDIDGNGVSDVMFVWSGNNYQHGYWMNGTSEWQSAGSGHPAEWENLGCYDMTGDGKADSVLIGNVVVSEVKGAYVGYYADANDLPDGSTWVNIGYLTNEDDIDWKNKIGNLTGNASGANSIVWYTYELGVLGAWTDGTENWVSIAGGFDANWALIGCGDFSGDGKDQIVMSLNSGAHYYAIGIDNTWADLGESDSGWEVRAIGDFSGDGMDDVVAFHKETGIVAMWGDGNSANWSQLGQLDASDWFIVGAGDYNGDQKDDLLVRQISTGMLGYYSGGNMETGWVELGRGVDMDWTVVSVTGDDTLAPVSSDIDGNGVSDVMFVWSGNNYQHGYWMNGTSEWQSAGSGHPAEWENLGCYDMTGDGKADSVLIGNVVVSEVKGAYVGYYADGDDKPDGSTWVNIGYLTNEDGIDWKNKIGNLTGNASGANSIVWYTYELGVLGAWTDGTENWVSIASGFDANWALIGCGDFSGDGKDQIVMSLDSGAHYYAVGIDGLWADLGESDSGWEVRAIGDFSGDGRDDIVAFHAETGLAAMWGDGVSSNWNKLGQLDASDWFVVGAGDYNGDQKDDLLVRQYSTGMLGYYSGGDMENGWIELGRGVDMDWTVVA